MMADHELRNLIARARRVHFGSLDGIHDLIVDALAYLHEPGYNINPVMEREKLETSLKSAVEEREKSSPR